MTSSESSKPTLILQSRRRTDGSIDFEWNKIEDFYFQLFRRVRGGCWEPRSIWNEKEKIDVLNVYPKEPYLKGWMTTPLKDDASQTPGKGMFNIDSVRIEEFNDNPLKYMKNDDGTWKYGVIFFGSADNNGGKDLSEKAYGIVQEFIDSGRGVLFGHDTVRERYTIFNKFADQLGIAAKEGGEFRISANVSIVKYGTITKFPWEIKGNLTVPATHTTGVYVGGSLKGTEWMTLSQVEKTIHPETGGHSHWYLVTNNNIGMIQTGH